MKQNNIPQDISVLENFTKEICYAVNDDGKYTKNLSKGWEVKASALDIAWDDISKRVENAKLKVERKEASPLLFFMELRIMDVNIVAAYTGFWRWQVKRHLKYDVFRKLSSNTLAKYAALFEVSVDELIHMDQR